jgi:hypothetical protein
MQSVSARFPRPILGAFGNVRVQFLAVHQDVKKVLGVSRVAAAPGF